jgi:hypothetical protein
MVVAATPRPGLEAPVLAFFTAVVPAPPAALAPNALLAIDLDCLVLAAVAFAAVILLLSD